MKDKERTLGNDLASGGYEGNTYQRPPVGKNIRWPNEVYTINAPNRSRAAGYND